MDFSAPVLEPAREKRDLAPHLLGIHLEGALFPKEEGAVGTPSRTIPQMPGIGFGTQHLLTLMGTVPLRLPLPPVPPAPLTPTLG